MDTHSRGPWSEGPANHAEKGVLGRLRQDPVAHDEVGVLAVEAQVGEGAGQAGGAARRSRPHSQGVRLERSFSDE